MGRGLFTAVHNANGDRLEWFGCPMWHGRSSTAYICGIAARISGQVITYVPKEFGRRFTSGKPILTINGQEYDIGNADMAGVLPGGFAGFEDSIARGGAPYGVCLGDAKRTTLFGIDSWNGEYNFKIFMQDDMRLTNQTEGIYGNLCMDAHEAPTDLGKKYGRVKYSESLFTWQQMDFICRNGLSQVGGCSENDDELKESHAHPIHSNEELCEETGVAWADAQAACANIVKKEFLDACLFEFCNDEGDDAVIPPEEVAAEANMVEEQELAEEVEVAEVHGCLADQDNAACAAASGDWCTTSTSTTPLPDDGDCVHIGKPGQDCNQVCEENGLECSDEKMGEIANEVISKEAMQAQAESEGFTCEQFVPTTEGPTPYIDPTDNTCYYTPGDKQKDELTCANLPTITTTTPPPPPNCNAGKPTGPYVSCNCRQDPLCDSWFFGGGSFWFHGMGVFHAASTKAGVTVQIFQCPWLDSRTDVAVINGVAVGFANSVITYTRASKDGGGAPQFRINGKVVNSADMSKMTFPGGWVIPGGDAFPHNKMRSRPLGGDWCIGDHDNTLQIAVNTESKGLGWGAGRLGAPNAAKLYETDRKSVV